MFLELEFTRVGGVLWSFTVAVAIVPATVASFVQYISSS